MSEKLKIKRKTFKKYKEELIEVPDLIEVQKKSFEWFLQEKLPRDKREVQGLEEVFQSIFPIKSNDGEVELIYKGYDVEPPKHTPEECIAKNLTYSAKIKAYFAIKNNKTGEVFEKAVYVGEVPYITDNGHFIVNGTERVVVTQIYKSPGVMFSVEGDEYIAKIVPDKGTWIEIGILGKKQLMYFKYNGKRKIPLTTFLFALGYSRQDILNIFFNPVKKAVESIRPGEYIIAHDVIVDGNNIIKAGTRLTETEINLLTQNDIKTVNVIEENSLNYYYPLYNTLEKDDTEMIDAMRKLLVILKSGNISTYAQLSEDKLKKEIEQSLLSHKKFDLGKVGRYKLVARLYKDLEEKEKEKLLGIRDLTREDIIRTIKVLIKVYNGEDTVDDADHLSNKRIRGVGEILTQVLKKHFQKIQRVLEDKLSTEENPEEVLHYIVGMKPIQSVSYDFFGLNPLSQFMDQTNPLAELTHKRRVTAAGPGGVSRERAGFEIRDIHHSHYGRLCPIETPEGQNIGIILSQAIYTKPNEYGFLQTPYRVVENGKVTNKVVYLTALEEEDYYIAAATEEIDENGMLKNNLVHVRFRGGFLLVPREQVQLMDLSAKQVFSISTSLIPFLEHDDANRALMGSNMQRQAVALLKPEPPIVGTGIERVVAKQSGYAVVAKNPGIVEKVNSLEIVIKRDDGERDIYKLKKFKGSNKDTLINQKPIVKVGDRVEAGEIIADGPCMKNGELALGTNLLVAFMPWYGYNYEDAIIISERLVKEDILTSIHIITYETVVKETRAGKEELTPNVPGVPREALRNLDENGIVRIGAFVKPGDVLVGKTAPKTEVVDTPEYRLLKAIFGEKAKDVKDTSLKVPHGEYGIVIGVDIFDRDEVELPPGVEKLIKVYVAQKRKIKVGDKISGRHGNKGVIAKIAPIEDMPFLPDGTPVDIVLNPLGVPSRMNLGQLFETLLGWAGIKLGRYYACPVFEGATEEELKAELREAGLPEDGKVWLRDGLTGEYFKYPVTVGYMYVMKLVHMVEDKIHARSTGTYSLITQQPLGGRAHFGGQRLGEMEVWALEAFGAAHTLQEMLTVKSDDIDGRKRIYEKIIQGLPTLEATIPESFKVLVSELRGLCLDVKVYDKHGRRIPITEREEKIIKEESKLGFKLIK